MIRGFRAISRAVVTVAVSAGMVCAATTGASALDGLLATLGDLLGPLLGSLGLPLPLPGA